MNKRIAAIDIGTVTTRLLVADVASAGCGCGCGQDAASDGQAAEGQKQICEVHWEINITHLGRHLERPIGQGAGESKLLSKEGISAVLNVLEEYVQTIKQLQVESVRCVATSAMRDAENAEELIDAARILGIDIEIISGEEEAQLAFKGACYGSTFPATLLVDPGGGSTEFVLGSVSNTAEGGKVDIQQFESVQIGSRRLTDLFIENDPPGIGELEDARRYIRKLCLPVLENCRGRFDQIIAVAGTATTLAAVLGKVDPYDPDKIQGAVVRRDELDILLQLFVSKTLEERRQIVGLEPQRAEVIVAGTLILEVTLDVLGCQQFTISDKDLLYGIMLEYEFFEREIFNTAHNGSINNFSCTGLIHPKLCTAFLSADRFF